MGALYAACMFLGVSNASSVQPIVSIERTVFYREKAAGMYSAIPYAFAQVSFMFLKKRFCKASVNVERLVNCWSSDHQGLVELPYILLQTIVYGVITYFMIDFERTASKNLTTISQTFLSCSLWYAYSTDMSSFHLRSWHFDHLYICLSVFMKNWKVKLLSVYFYSFSQKTIL